ncbi:MAG: hypothetical protein N4J56_004175 [Chroococcidiopsis sp. SAG 2025]|uniref:hypothetical protein n=1 Tax=Chroococcidiopsis sp. SAG 2025 TaxID=171389 RepID=UPI002936DEDB|nr:hypothetical protein [Chroococcidiopsis sp. SAG 2025]MDV2994521.1 hypothetical protein [Chroococcidiopsis sp. SAG 2025]
MLPIFQPAHSPELTPIERLWEDLKKYFKGKNFNSLSLLRDKVFDLINSLSSTVIVSLTGWSYIVEALEKVSENSA